jgi:hypothetical protein
MAPPSPKRRKQASDPAAAEGKKMRGSDWESTQDSSDMGSQRLPTMRKKGKGKMLSIPPSDADDEASKRF